MEWSKSFLLVAIIADNERIIREQDFKEFDIFNGDFDLSTDVLIN